MNVIALSDKTYKCMAFENSLGMSKLLNTADIVIISLEVLILSLMVFFHIQTHATDCRGQLITKTKTPDGLTCTREAKLSIQAMLQNFKH